MNANRWGQGIVEDDSQNVIARPEMPIDELVGNKAIPQEPAQDTGPGYCYIRVGPVVICGHEWFVGVYFFHGQIHSVRMGMSPKSTEPLFGYIPPFGESSKELAYYKTLIRDQIGADSAEAFPWGTIGAAWDGKGGSTAIRIRYGAFDTTPSSPTADSSTSEIKFAIAILGIVCFVVSAIWLAVRFLAHRH
ncbi:MAG: hypothetical protein NTW19_10615 [Planctomycetota bacterium]|nr:hypothetical protein [Planctomycetota bacterium]